MIILTETKKVIINCSDVFLTKVPNTNAWFQSNSDGNPILNKGEKEVAEKAGKAIKNSQYEVWVTIGPYRAFDIAGTIDLENKIIRIDLYSVRPGTDEELAEILLNAERLMVTSEK